MHAMHAVTYQRVSHLLYITDLGDLVTSSLPELKFLDLASLIMLKPIFLSRPMHNIV